MYLRIVDWKSIGGAAMAVAAATTAVAFADTTPATATGTSGGAPTLAADDTDAMFQDAIRGYIPLTPGQVGALRSRMMDFSGAVNLAEPNAVTRKTRTVSVRPGARPPTVDLLPGYVTAVRFVDATGAPWPITSVTVGNPAWFSVVKPERLEPGNLLTVSASMPKVHSNIVVTLENEDTPVVIVLHTVAPVSTEGNDGKIKTKIAVDGAVTYRLQRRGPRAKQPVFVSGGEPAVSPTMLAFLDATPPTSARRMKTDPPLTDTQVWSMDGAYYVRTRRSMTWPAWTAVASQDGVRAYRLAPVESLLLTDDNTPVSIVVDDLGYRY